ncbi:SDR family NAD(P)-dependent oxidoreductase [Streptomyces sp. 4F14]|uniref:SDR family NAD(P)-dependent oxidoreductase n=1 Tax=Streptomyces sp. 4F14 TaxID=3394380 RepID=UPI003A86A876
MPEKTIAIFGAGTGLGAATARRFGREGYAAALVARRKEPLDELVAALDKEGIEAAAFPADLSDSAGVPALVDRVSGHFGRIDVIEYAPIGAAKDLFLPAAQVAADFLRPIADLYLHTPIEIARAVVPQMVERGEGGLLFGQGMSALSGYPGMSGLGAVLAATRNWFQSLHGELADKGVYVGAVTVAGLVEGTAGHQAAYEADPTLGGMPLIPPAELADQYWDMFTKRDRLEQIVPAPAVS